MFKHCLCLKLLDLIQTAKYPYGNLPHSPKHSSAEILIFGPITYVIVRLYVRPVRPAKSATECAFSRDFCPQCYHSSQIINNVTFSHIRHLARRRLQIAYTEIPRFSRSPTVGWCPEQNGPANNTFLLRSCITWPSSRPHNASYTRLSVCCPSVPRAHI